MAIETHKNFPCENCDSVKYKKRDGLWICVVCKAENTDIVVEEFDEDPNVSSYRMKATVSRAEAKSEDLSFIRNRDQGNRPWLTIEALQQILRGKALSICRELQLDESASSKILLLLREMWLTYLRGRLLCFGSDSNPVNFRDRDSHMYRAIKNDGFNGFEKTSYDPMQYKKTPKDVELGIYSAGNTTHFEFTSSDSEPEAQVALNRVKKLKRKRKNPSSYYQRVSLPDVQAIIFLGFRVLGYPLSFKSIFKHCFIDEVKNYLPSHMTPTSVDLFLKKMSLNQGMSEESLVSRNKLHRVTLAFVHHHLINPLSQLLDQLNSNNARGSLLIREMKSKLCELQLPESFCALVNQSFPYFLQKIDAVQKDKIEVFLPFIDIWALAIIYICMVSSVADKEVPWQAWCHGWVAKKNKENNEEFLKNLIDTEMSEARINFRAKSRIDDKKNFQIVQTMPTIENVEAESPVMPEIEVCFQSKLKLPKVELDEDTKYLIHASLPSKVQLQAFKKFDKRHVSKESYSYYRHFIRHLRNESNHLRLVHFEDKKFIGNFLRTIKKKQKRRYTTYEHELPRPWYLDTFAELACVSQQQFVATVLILLDQ